MNLNKELRSTASELALANTDMESFNYSVSHDLRAPLRITGGLAAIILEDHSDKLYDEVKKILKSIKGATFYFSLPTRVS